MISTIIAAIKTTLEGVTGIGNVYGYERWANNHSKFLDLFRTDADTINGWVISRASTAQQVTAYRKRQNAHVFTIKGFYGLKDADASETTFQALLDNIQTAFESDITLNGTVKTTCPNWGQMSGAAGLQITSVEARMFGNILCHYAECRLGAIEE